MTRSALSPTEAACRAAIHAAAANYLPKRCQERKQHVAAFLVYQAASSGLPLSATWETNMAALWRD